MSWDRENLVLVLLLTICVLLWFLQTFLQDVLYTKTPDYLQTQQQIKNVLIKNDYLKLQLLEDESYTKIANEAANKGFIKAIFITP